MNAEEFLALHPKLYHMAEENSWPSICRHGLLSTEALLDLFQVECTTRERLLSCRRPESVTISHPLHGSAIIRDQKPMSDGALEKCLLDNITPAEWYRNLNSRTFFWTTRDRLLRLLGARAYRGKRHCILTIATDQMFARHQDAIRLSPLNSGSTIFNPQPRGNQTFLPLECFPYAEWRKKRSPNKIFVELAVNYMVPDISEFTEKVELMHETEVLEVLYSQD